MKEYDAIVIGSGCGMNIVLEALAHNWKVALVDKGPLGGTCPNNGCIPSKILIHTADRLMEARESEKLGVKLRVEGADFGRVMGRMRRSVEETQAQMREGLRDTPNLDYYEGHGEFFEERSLEVNGERIRGRHVFIASGSRPLIPPIPGLDGVAYLTNESLLLLTELPESVVIVGGGYVAAEYGHFFAAMGSSVTMVEMLERLVSAEEPEVSELLREELGSRMQVLTNTAVELVERSGDGVKVTARNRLTGAIRELTGQKLLVAAGRVSNADLLRVDRTGIKTDKRGYVPVNEYMETNVKHVYAVGDATGVQMFTHAANKESVIAANNALHKTRASLDHSATPHAVYSRPQIASVGLGEAEARKRYKVLLGRARYSDVAKGEAMMEQKGFAKAIVNAENGRILGFHVVGPYAPIVIQEVVNAMAVGGDLEPVRAGMHIHPELTELIQRTIEELQEG